MDKKRFPGVAAGIVLILLQPALLVLIAVKAAAHFLRIVLDPRIHRGDVLSKFFRSLVLLGTASMFFIGLHYYNELIDMEHFLQVAHGRLMVEMQRKQVVLATCRNAVAMYAAMEEKIQDRLIKLHGLTKTHGPRAQIVKSERLEIMNLIRELDLLIEKYPDLKSKGPYVLLMETIQDTGFRITTERLNYNDWTYNYNVMCHVFPYRIVAFVCGFREQPFFYGPLNYASLEES
jgi:LemA protein